jgi:hypothetical protein
MLLACCWHTKSEAEPVGIIASSYDLHSLGELPCQVHHAHACILLPPLLAGCAEHPVQVVA